LDAIPDTLPEAHTTSATILVLPPATKPVYNTTSMIYSEHPYQINAFVLNQWARTPSEMLQSLMVETLTQSHYFKAVVTPPYVGHYTYALNTRIFELQQDYTGPSPLLRLSVQAQLIKSSTQNVIATKVITINESILEKTPYSGVVAANKAVSEMLYELTAFVNTHT
jgi:cholesterol transport system auxiliary component